MHTLPKFALLHCVLLAGVVAAAPQLDSSPKFSSAKPDTKGDYILQPSDLLKVKIFQEDDLNQETRISQENTITMPLIGVVDLKNKTVRQAEDLIRDRYGKDYLAKPQVHIQVMEYAPRRVFVFGAVGKPGDVLFQQEQGLTLVDAISRAGSLNRMANKNKVTLKRTKPDGSTETRVIDMEELTKGDKAEKNDAWPLEPGDVINVPEKII